MTPERRIQNAICEYLDLHPTRCAYRTNSEAARRFRKTKRPVGFPDISGDWDGRALYIEVKQPGGVLSSHQHEFGFQAKKRGAIFVVAKSVDDVVDALSALHGVS